MATPVNVGHLRFRAKKDAQLYFREMLNRYQLGDIVSENDLKDLIAIISRHPESDVKIGCGISYVKVIQNPEYKNQRCFWIFRVDGTDTDFSYLTCIDGKPKSVEREFIEACRVSVVEQVIEYKEQFFNRDGKDRCEETGVLVTWDNCHVDHVIPFSVIVRDFIDLNRILPSKEMLSKSEDRQCSVKFVCQKTESEWQAYHRAFAKLRVVSPEFNLCRKRG